MLCIVSSFLCIYSSKVFSRYLSLFASHKYLMHLIFTFMTYGDLPSSIHFLIYSSSQFSNRKRANPFLSSCFADLYTVLCLHSCFTSQYETKRFIASHFSWVSNIKFSLFDTFLFIPSHLSPSLTYPNPILHTSSLRETIFFLLFARLMNFF